MKPRKRLHPRVLRTVRRKAERQALKELRASNPGLSEEEIGKIEYETLNALYQYYERKYLKQVRSGVFW